MEVEKRVRAERAMSNQGNLPEGVESGTPKTDSDVPKRNTKYLGHQGGFTGFQTGGQQQQDTQNSQDQDLPQGGQGWRKRITHHDDSKKGSVADLSRDAQLGKLTDPTVGLQDNKGNSVGMPKGFKDRTMGKGALTSADETTLSFPATTIKRGAGKNQSSRQSQQSEDSEQSSQISADPKPIPYPTVTKTNDGASKTKDSASDASKIKATSGDEAGTIGGIVSSGTAKVPIERGASKVLQGYVPVVKVKPSNMGNVTPNPDAVDESHLPAFIKNNFEKQYKDPREIEAERKRQVTLPGENGHAATIDRDDIQVTGKDMVNKLTDGRIQPVDQGGTTGSVGSGTTPDVDINPVTGQPKRDKTRGGGGDPAGPETN